MNQEAIYKVIDIKGVFPITLESTLNNFSKEGYKVVTSTENFIIMEKQIAL